jgi:hypothetical protein
MKRKNPELIPLLPPFQNFFSRILPTRTRHRSPSRILPRRREDGIEDARA